MPTITTRIFANADLPDALQPILTAWDAECFIEPNDYDWQPPQWHVMVYADGEPVSHIGVVQRECTVDGQPILLTGIASVMTPAKYRKHGYANAGLKDAQDFMRDKLDARFGLLVTHTYLIPFYERIGWQDITAQPMWVLLPDGSRGLYDDIRMILPLHGDDWPEGEIDLCGIPW